MIMKLNWYTKYLLRLNPKTIFQQAAAEQGFADNKIDAAEALFRNAKRVDIQPFPNETGRGFVITLDNVFSLWFYQNGDAFQYDGFEIGPYDNGDITVFDRAEP